MYNSPKELWPKEGRGNGFQTIEAGKIICNAASPIPPAGYDNLCSCRLHLPYEHWHKVLVIDGKSVIDWNKECP